MKYWEKLLPPLLVILFFLGLFNNFILAYALHNIVNGTENFKKGEILLALVQITLFHFKKILLGQNTIQVTSKYSGLGRNLNRVVPEFERAPNFMKN